MKTINVEAFDETEANSLAAEHGLLLPYETTALEPPPATTKQIDYARTLGIPIPMNATLGDMSMLISYAVDEQIDFSKIPSYTGKGWTRWPSALHQQVQQRDRQERAKSSQYIPRKLFAETQEAAFQATEGKMLYRATLESCECLDYRSATQAAPTARQLCRGYFRQL